MEYFGPRRGRPVSSSLNDVKGTRHRSPVKASQCSLDVLRMFVEPLLASGSSPLPNFDINEMDQRTLGRFTGCAPGIALSVFHVGRQLTAIGCELSNHLLMQPDVHRRGIVGVA